MRFLSSYLLCYSLPSAHQSVDFINSVNTPPFLLYTPFLGTRSLGSPCGVRETSSTFYAFLEPAIKVIWDILFWIADVVVGRVPLSVSPVQFLAVSDGRSDNCIMTYSSTLALLLWLCQLCASCLVLKPVLRRGIDMAEAIFRLRLYIRGLTLF